MTSELVAAIEDARSALVCADPAIAKSVDSWWERSIKLDRFSHAEALDMAINGFDKSDFVELMNMLDAHLR